jgi:hypothetical protein
VRNRYGPHKSQRRHSSPRRIVSSANPGTPSTAEFDDDPMRSDYDGAAPLNKEDRTMTWRPALSCCPLSCFADWLRPNRGPRGGPGHRRRRRSGRTNTVVVIDGERISPSATARPYRRRESHRPAGPDADARFHQLPRTSVDVRRRLPERTPPGFFAYKALMGLAALQRMLLAGWTTVRVMGDADVYYANQDIRKTIDGCFHRAAYHGRRPLPLDHRRRRRRQVLFARAEGDRGRAGRRRPGGNPQGRT